MPLRAIARLIQTMLYAQRFFPYYVYNILGGIEDDGAYLLYYLQHVIRIADLYSHLWHINFFHMAYPEHNLDNSCPYLLQYLFTNLLPGCYDYIMIISTNGTWAEIRWKCIAYPITRLRLTSPWDG